MSFSTPDFNFGTKSETLARLQTRVGRSKILPLYYFTATQWLYQKTEILAAITGMDHGGCVIIRSSAQNEDSQCDSMAGAFTSCLNVPVDSQSELEQAIERVITSFGQHQHGENQILVQPMLRDIQMSGVVMTHDLEHGAPYYVINYDDESGLTDTITGGVGIQKTVLIYRDTDHSLVRSTRIQGLLAACRELEALCGRVPLDIEFAIDRQECVYILQVRRITLCNTWHPVTERRVARQLAHIRHYLEQTLPPQCDLFGGNSLLGVMPDWNPAEIIGTMPRPLASSLYRLLVTDSAWREARARMGYYHPRHQVLMVMLGHHPYIDVRSSFNSFLPAGLDDATSERLVTAWLERLREHPEWHDKVEFEVVQTCLDFTFEADFEVRYAGCLTSDAFQTYRQELGALTYRAIVGEGEGSLAAALVGIHACAVDQERRGPIKSWRADLVSVKRLLLACREFGTVNFAILARHAFIAEELLRSACRRGAISMERVQLWKQSLHTVTTDLTTDYAAVFAGTQSADHFLSRFGHLRPGTYDITSLRYDERHDLFATTSGSNGLESVHVTRGFELQPDEEQALQRLLDERSWPVTAAGLLTYAGQAVQAREYAKLIFTRDLSDALALLNRWGGEVGLAREDLSYLDIFQLLDTLASPLLDDIDRVVLNWVDKARHEYQQAISLKLGHLISGADDVFVVPIHRSLPNFITQKRVEAEGILLQQDTPVTTVLQGRIVCIENADPGYDWVFTRNIAGLVTQYGGANSHMAIRCAEFGIPAAIGCGEQLFSRLLRCRGIVLNCQDKTINLV
ncbi:MULTISPECIES: PEP-utilizing enzyme [unclassified Aeromonas]|uniref:PEP-utilizing enzyme n=1 Tax=unclassified Aeromonas TaxID=257493 RepID=UPI00084B0353|nr:MULTISPECIES: PEP-utilizing enzyme [unclassified Aeromonas]OEC54058.1 pyruvate, phosphate dikinase [Aeromonas sp. ANNP30]OEC64984.1 pyruvate, phosphate dikinase [Aeromonas sp. ANP5]